MMKRRRHNLVLSIYPSSRGFAFALFEGALAPVDWGIFEARGRGKNRRCLVRIAQLLKQYTPDIVVLQDMSEAGTARARRIRRLNMAIEALAEERQLPATHYSRERVRVCFAPLGAATKDAIAAAIAKRIPAFERYVPPIRKPWMSEHVNMGLFDAAALALTFFHDQGEG
jgi:Holliday junction resolvasome RuvABC endonuclease subunit